MLTDAQRLARDGKLTASKVGCLMTGDREKIMEVWRELCGDPSYAEPSLDDIWQVRLGQITEPLNLEWYTKMIGNALTRQGEVVVHPDYQWAAATLDAFDSSLPGPVEAKCVSGFEKYETVLQRYMPQLHWQMIVTKTQKCAFSVIQGARRPYVEVVNYDQAYGDELFSRAQKLMECVWSLAPPVEMAPMEKQISRLRDYNMTGNNYWAAAAKDWTEHQSASIAFKNAEAKIREMVPADGASASGHGIIARRDRALRISIKPV
jgi:hypothetical protein